MSISFPSASSDAVDRSRQLPARLLLTNALMLALAACGGGGSNVRQDPPPPSQPTPVPAPAPTPAPTDQIASPTPGPLQQTPEEAPHTYRGTVDNLHLTTGVAQAHQSGLRGRGVTVGVLDAGFLGSETHLPSAAFATHYQDYTTGKSVDATNVVNFQHGHYVTAALAGQPSTFANGATAFEGGVAPEASLHWGRICENGSCSSAAVRTALQDWVTQGLDIDVLNLSINADRSSNASLHQQSSDAWNAAFSPLAGRDTLLVISTGNSSNDSPGFPAALPLHHPQWRDQLLAVGAVQVNADGSPGTIAGYSNRCGDAAQWCLVAPGAQYVGAMTDTQHGNGWVNGTSIAAPVVAGVAALVKQAHPWMSASNLQQTLLSTATDLGDPGVDAIYGWGAVNAAKAVRGPSQITGTFKAHVGQGQDSVLSNDITGSGVLEKTGSGRLDLAGNNRFEGGVIIGGGTLGLAGDLAAALTLHQGRLEALGGRIDGHFTATSGTQTRLAIGNPLYISGNATLDGELHLRGIVDGYTPSAIETLLQADTIQGRFAAVSVDSGLFYTATLGYDDHHVSAQLQRTSASAAASAAALPAQVIEGAAVVDQVLDGLERASTSAAPIDRAATQRLDTLLQAPQEDAINVLRGLAASEHGSHRTLLMQSALGALSDQATQLAGLPDRTDHASWWVQADTRSGNYRPLGYASTDHRQNDLRVGMDVPVGDNGQQWRLSLSRVSLDGHSDDGSHFDSDRLQLIAGVKQPTARGWFALQLSAEQGQVLTTRQQWSDLGADPLRSQHDQQLLGARLETGFHLPYGLSPYLAVGVLHQRQDGFVESSQDGWGLQTRPASDTVGFVESGLRLKRRAGAWTHDAALSWRHLPGGNRSMHLDANLTGLPAVTVQTARTHLPANTVQLSLGTSWEISPRIRAFGRLGLEQSDSFDDAINASLGVNVAF